MTESQPGAWTFAPLLRPNDVAQLLSVSRAWVYEAARIGRIPSFRLGGDDGPLRFVAEDIEQWLAEARGSWLPGRTSRSRLQSVAESGEDRAGNVDRSVVPIRGQQSLLSRPPVAARAIASSVAIAPAARTCRSRWP